MTISVSAPGKVVLLGEYAVLEGAPALVMAVDRRARVTLTPGRGPDCAVSAPTWAPETARFSVGPDGADWAAGNSRRFDLAGHVIRGFYARHACATGSGPFTMVLDSSSLMAASDGGAKLGLGSSAALTVAMWRALGYYAALQQPAPQPDLAELIEVHAGFQSRRGSGLDVAASLHGGLLEFHRGPPPRARPSRLPEDIRYCFVWSGRQASTSRFLADLERWRESDDRQYRRFMDELRTVAEAAARAAADGDGPAFLAAVAEYAAGLRDVGRASGTDIVSAPHARLTELAARDRVVYKPCGAGGGDIGVALSRDPEALARFRARVEAERFQILSLQIDRSGVTTQSG